MRTRSDSLTVSLTPAAFAWWWDVQFEERCAKWRRVSDDFEQTLRAKLEEAEQKAAKLGTRVHQDRAAAAKHLSGGAVRHMTAKHEAKYLHYLRLIGLLEERIQRRSRRDQVGRDQMSAESTEAGASARLFAPPPTTPHGPCVPHVGHSMPRKAVAAAAPPLLASPHAGRDWIGGDLGGDGTGCSGTCAGACGGQLEIGIALASGLRQPQQQPASAPLLAAGHFRRSDRGESDGGGIADVLAKRMETGLAVDTDSTSTSSADRLMC
jgi:hypothetical protein